MRSIALILSALACALTVVNSLPSDNNIEVSSLGDGTPNLNIPSSKNTVSVRIIDTTSLTNGLPTFLFVEPPILGLETLSVPAYSFLIEHRSGRKLVFDLGVRVDPENLAPGMRGLLTNNNATATAKKGVAKILKDGGVNPASIEAIIWSHFHFDHSGDPSTFPSSVDLVVGPGFKNAFGAGYPANPDAPVLATDYQGRELREVVFTNKLIGDMKSFDYFGDGSFYILDCPGHSLGHICGLARVKNSPDSFIFMGGDVTHHTGELRPSKFTKLPATIYPNPFNPRSPKGLNSKIFLPLLPNGDRNKSFYKITNLGTLNGVYYSYADAEESVAKVQAFDASNDVLVVMAHDGSLLNVFDFFPKYANDFKNKGWKERGRWSFLQDFAVAVGAAREGED